MIDVHSNQSINKQRINHKLDFFYNFLYSNRVGIRVSKLFPKKIKSVINSFIYSIYSHGFTSIPKTDDKIKKMIARKVELDIYKIEDLLGRQLSVWKTFYANI